MIFVVYSDWDGSYINEYTNEDLAKAEKLVAEILNKEPDNGTRLLRVIKGEALTPEKVEMISKIKLIEGKRNDA
jgi:hypothetical protein